jgi:hypothetical protein
MFKKWNLKAFPNSQWNAYLGEQDPLDARSYT